MLIFIDARAPRQAAERLRKEGEVVEFETSGICYEAISGHPDIFMFQHPGGLVVAPNIPQWYLDILAKEKVQFIIGENKVGNAYPETAHYNALYTPYGILHNKKITDPMVSETYKEKIHCAQGYVRCTTLWVGDGFITSDRGIHTTLLRKKINSFYVDPKSISLPGFNNGFIGGVVGISDKRLYFCGKVNSLIQGKDLISYLDNNYEIIELYQGPPVDIGGIFFIPASGSQTI